VAGGNGTGILSIAILRSLVEGELKSLVLTNASSVVIASPESEAASMSALA
jgi:hypothetical protein